MCVCERVCVCARVRRAGGYGTRGRSEGEGTNLQEQGRGGGGEGDGLATRPPHGGRHVPRPESKKSGRGTCTEDMSRPMRGTCCGDMSEAGDVLARVDRLCVYIVSAYVIYNVFYVRASVRVGARPWCDCVWVCV